MKYSFLIKKSALMTIAVLTLCSLSYINPAYAQATCTAGEEGDWQWNITTFGTGRFLFCDGTRWRVTATLMKDNVGGSNWGKLYMYEGTTCPTGAVKVGPSDTTGATASLCLESY